MSSELSVQVEADSKCKLADEAGGLWAGQACKPRRMWPMPSRCTRALRYRTGLPIARMQVI